ncbi:Uncharacterised protein [Mycobacteroides abscessus subsp. abscessus]|nr:Uncharacterised protein [Mycobacteroides abscessus subsp. abscessus]
MGLIQVFECLVHFLRIFNGQIEAARTVVFMGIALDRLTHSRCIDDRQHLVQVIPEETVEQDDITII